MSEGINRCVNCNHCGETFDGDGQALYRCPHCSRWTHGPPPNA